MATRSKKLGAQSTTEQIGQGTLVYVVPPGFTTILKHIHTANYGATNAIIVISIVPAGGPDHLLINLTALAPYTPEDWTGWVVLDEGDQLTWGADRDHCQIWASGAELVD